MDYRAVDPRLGTMDDLEAAAGRCASAGMSLCIDLVLNHTAREHAWARAWLAGDPEYADFYSAFPDRTMPDAYEATISDVFPDRAPGSFTWVARERAAARAAGCGRRSSATSGTSTTRTPTVFAAMLGRRSSGWPTGAIEIFRMDAVPFMWKRLGTACMNQPEVHDLVQAAARAGPAGRARRRSSRPRRSCRPRTWCPTSAATTATAPSASWPTTTSSW